MMVYYSLLFYNINFQLRRLCLDLILQERIIKDSNDSVNIWDPKSGLRV